MEHLHLARYKSHGKNFEIVVNPDIALKFKDGEISDVSRALNSEHVYNDAKKGDLASENAMKEVFGTGNALEVAAKIIRKGEVQLTSEHREKEREEKRKKIVGMIHRYAVDPKTNIPHPLTRIENAISEAKVRIDENKSAEDQIQGVIKALRPIIPIRLEVKEIQVTLKAEHAAKFYNTVKQYGNLVNEEWLNDGSWQGLLDVPAGLEPELYDKLNSATHGEVETKVIKVK